ncbi:MAG TPA: hypothetical protein VKA36_10750, partial [Solirubrobacterales bacterium]|nr:hypothetical protein [Solirubrobacterales bacterium]
MSRIRNQSPALVVAVIALIAALAGTAVGGVAVTALNKQEKKQVKKIAKQQGKRQGRKQAKRQITKREPDLDVRSALFAGQANGADTANGVRPVPVKFRRGPSSGPVQLLSAGGALVEGECDQFGRTLLTLTSTANNSSR